MKAQLLAGRDFSPAFPTDTTAFIINEEAATLMGMRDPIGQELHLWDRKGKIIGVIKDFHFGSVHDPIKPLILLFKHQIDDGHILVRTNPGQTAQALAGLKTALPATQSRLSLLLTSFQTRLINGYIKVKQ